MTFWTRLYICALALCSVAFTASAARSQVIDGVSLHVERRGHTAIPLNDGRVLIVGGENATGVVREAEVFDATSQTFLIVGTSSGRTDHTATLLSDGRVLIAGGRDGAATLGSTEIFNPADNSFSAGPALNRARAGHTATTLADGRILFAGGDALGSSEIYDPAAQAFVLTGDLTEPRALHGAAMLKDGRVLIAGGVDPLNSAQILDSAETYNPQTGQFSSAATTMGIARALPVIKVLPDGKVQIIGGSADFSMEMFNPETAAFSALAHLPPTTDLLAATLSTESRAALISTAIADAPGMQSLLQDPAVAELLDRSDYTVTEIPQVDRALVAGGVNSQNEVLSASALVSSSQATVTTDKFDYPPGKTVTVTGSGFQPGEQVSMLFHEEPETHPDVTATSTADNGGGFVNTDFAPATSDAGRTFTLTAVGSVSFKSAQTAFTDANAAIEPRRADCGGSTLTSFNFGDAVCARMTGLGNGTFVIHWIKPDGTTQFAFTFTTSSGNFTDVRTPTADCGTWTLTVFDSTDTVQIVSTTFTLGNCVTAAKLAFITAPFAINVGSCSPAIQVQIQTNAGTPVAPSFPTTVNLSSDSSGGSFFTNNTCTAATTSVTIPGGSSTTANFFYKDSSGGSPTLTASTNGLASATQTETIGKADPTVATVIHNPSHATVTSVTAGTTVHDTATVTGSVGTPTGTVTFSWFANGTCTGTPAQTSGTFTLTSGTVDATTFTQTPNTSGSFAFQATYNGDATYNSKVGACEVLTVNKIDPTAVTTAIHNETHAVVTSVTAGTTVHDSASVTGAFGTPTGTVTFTWFGNGSCTGTPTATSGTFTLTSGTADATTFTQTPNTSGSFAFQATYNGDVTYNSKVGACEVLTVGKVNVGTFTTAIHNAAHGTVTSVDAGTTVHDQATLTANGSLPVPTGSVTFSWYANGSCTGTPTATSGTFTLTSGTVDATTFTQTPNTSGSFAFQASYSGDGTYNSATAGCETLSVTKIDPTAVTTSIHDGTHAVVTSVNAGTTVHDSASVTGSVGTPSGTVTFSWYANGTCAGTPSATSGTFTLTSGTVDATAFTQTPSASGSFAFQATYNGDVTYNSKVGACEVLTVGKVNVGSFTTEIHNNSNNVVTSVNAGTTVHDKATLTANGSLPVPTGSVTFSWYTNGSCTGTPTATSGTFSLTSGAVDGTTFTQTPNTSGSFAFQASYSGDGTYNSATAGCETLSVGKIDPTAVTTAIHNAAHATVSTVAAGTTVHDSATVSGALATPTGSVTFRWFENGTCTGTPTMTSGTFTLTSGTVDATTFTQTPTDASKTYSFLASYSGDNTYNSKDAGCEALSLNKVDATVVTEIHDGTDAVVTSVVAGTAVHDKATVSGGVGTPTGTVTFNWFSNGSCTGTPTATSGTFTLTSGTVDATTFAQTPGASGSFAFQASYSGDNTYNSKLGPCEVLSVGKIEATVATEIHDGSHAVVTSVDVGTAVHDKATVTGGLNTPTGSVTFTWFTNGTCSGTPSQTSGTFTLTGGTVDATTFVQTPGTSGSFAFRASYSGDGTYNAKLGPCEALTVNKIDPTVTTVIHNAAHGPIAFALSGTSVHDFATVSGTAGTPTGNVTFKWFANGSCTGTAAATSSALALSGGTVDATTFAQTPDFHTSTSYGFQATYNGDGVYNSKTGACETLTILIQETQITTSLSGGGQSGASITVQAGIPVTDTSSLSGATANAGGTVTYTVFSENTCTTVFANAGTKTVTNGVVPASNPITFTNAQTGVYYWRADYSGDISNDSSTSGCSEQLTVTPHTITLAFDGGGFVPKITAPLPKAFKSPGVEVDISFTDILHDGVRVDITATARNVANNCAKPLTPSTATAKQFSVLVSQKNLDTVHLAFKLYEVTKAAMKTAQKAKCESLTLEISAFSAVGVDALGVQSNTLSLLGEGDPPVLNIVVPLPTKKKNPAVLTASGLRSAAAASAEEEEEEAEFEAMRPGTPLPPPERR